MKNLISAKRIAKIAFDRQAYEASGALEKVMGKILSRDLGITDAPQTFFEKAEADLMERIQKHGLELDLENPEIYPYLRQAIMDTLDELGLMG